MKLQHEWNGRFQEILSQPDSVEKFNSLSNLAQSFVDTAEQYGSIIIDELSLPYGKKTIKPGRYMHAHSLSLDSSRITSSCSLAPVSLGGNAGGTKYICAGILFKVTYALFSPPPPHQKTTLFD